MALKKDIVVVNEFTMKHDSLGGGGTRGATPGDYVLRYMARDKATEVTTPIRHNDVQNFVYRYMAREEAVENLEIDDRYRLKSTMSQAQGKGGVAFGYGSVSLSHEGLIAAKNDIQNLFDDGHTVMKTVLSFDTDYLKKYGILPEDFEVNQRGDFRGQLDQMKLRMAVMSGLDRMGRQLYDDLRYVAVIQVDTEHVHAHIAMVDAGKGTLAPDGTQKGKLNNRAKTLIRRGVDDYLDEKQTVKHLASSVTYERRNVSAYVKKWAFNQVSKESPLQFLIACLPDDRSMWSAGSNRKEMRKANDVAHDLVMDVLTIDENSPFIQAQKDIRAYATERKNREGLGSREYEKLIHTGEKRIIDQAVNGLYGLLRTFPEDYFDTMTPTLDVMSMNYDRLVDRAGDKDADELLKFSYRLRSYATRRDYHRKKRDEFVDRRTTWQTAYDAGVADERSYALKEFYDSEIEYHNDAYMKYLYFLPPAIHDDDWYEEWNTIRKYSQQCEALNALIQDRSIQRMSDYSEAEKMGREIYGQHGGALVARNTKATKKTLAQRYAAMLNKREQFLETFSHTLTNAGLVATYDAFDLSDLETKEGMTKPFDDIKGVDLHHLGFDFVKDVPLGSRALAAFNSTAVRRLRTLRGLEQYLRLTDQSEAIAQFDIDDIRIMGKHARVLRYADEPVLTSEIDKLKNSSSFYRRMRTVSLDDGVADEAIKNVENSVKNTNVNELMRDLSIDRDTYPEL